MIVVDVCFCFFFKQKTAYEMRISDWSSDVCSSDLRKRWPKFREETPRGASGRRKASPEPLYVYSFGRNQGQFYERLLIRQMPAQQAPFCGKIDRKSTRLNSSH